MVCSIWPYVLHYFIAALVKVRIIEKRKHIDLSETEKITRLLIVGPDGLGDCVLFSPALRYIREKYKKQHITILTRSGVKEYLLTCPYVDQVIACDQKMLAVSRILRDIKFIRSLRNERFDCVINALWMPTEISGFLTYITGAPIRIGCVYYQPLLARMKTGVLFTHCLEIQEQKHVLEYSRALLQCLDIHPDPNEYRPEVWSTLDDRTFAADFTTRVLAKSKCLVAISPVAGSPVRLWPAKYYAAVADYCMSRYQAMVVILGGASDVGIAAQIVEAMEQTPLNLAGRATFAQTGEILKRSHLFVGNDSGPMHLAAAAGVPVIALFSSGNYVHYAPYGQGHQIVRQDLPCYPCDGICVFQEPVCLTTITPDEVIRRIGRVLDLGPTRVSTSFHLL